MDWFSWLSKTSLDPSLTYEYGLIFARNELQEEDLTYFNHEFLQSMGISVAKHRLEILKLARKEIGGRPHPLSRLILAINKTKRCLTKCVSRWVFHDEPVLAKVPKLTPYQALDRRVQEMSMAANSRPKVVSGPVDGRVQERLLLTTRSPKVVSGPLDRRMQERLLLTNRSPKVVSGPLDRRMQERLLLTNRSPKVVSGPLDGRMQETWMLTNRSPMVSGPQVGRVASPNVHGLYDKEEMDGDYGVHSLWATLFQDMKPT